MIQTMACLIGADCDLVTVHENLKPGWLGKIQGKLTNFNFKCFEVEIRGSLCPTSGVLVKLLMSAIPPAIVEVETRPRSIAPQNSNMAACQADKINIRPKSMVIIA